MNRQAICFGEVDRDKLDLAFHESRNQSDIASQTVEAGDCKDGPVNPAQPHRLEHVRPIVVSTAFNSGKLADELARTGFDIA